jgi:hypothetical protein
LSSTTKTASVLLHNEIQLSKKIEANRNKCFGGLLLVVFGERRFKTKSFFSFVFRVFGNGILILRFLCGDLIEIHWVIDGGNGMNKT